MMALSTPAAAPPDNATGSVVPHHHLAAAKHERRVAIRCASRQEVRATCRNRSAQRRQSRGTNGRNVPEQQRGARAADSHAADCSPKKAASSVPAGDARGEAAHHLARGVPSCAAAATRGWSWPFDRRVGRRRDVPSCRARPMDGSDGGARFGPQMGTASV